MRAGVLGINYKSCDLHLRELLARACQRLFRSDSSEAAEFSIVLLSTCNRTEIYFSAPDLADAHSELLNLLRQEIDCPFEHKLYSYFGGDCFTHLARVASGLDSAIVSETEIQRQVKIAYAGAAFDHALSSPVHFLFQKSLKTAKTIRSSFPLPRGTPTLEGIIFDLCKNLNRDSSLFFVGNSEINRKILAYFKGKGMHRLNLCTRGVLSAQEVALDYQVRIVDWSSVSSWQEHDIVICGSNYPEYLIYPEQLDRSAPLKNRFIFDLSMPRNVDPRVGRHPKIHLLNIEELSQLIAATRSSHLQDMRQAENMLQASIERQIALYHHKERKACLCA